jgi:hypothetical protein
MASVLRRMIFSLGDATTVLVMLSPVRQFISLCCAPRLISQGVNSHNGIRSRLLLLASTQENGFIHS